MRRAITRLCVLSVLFAAGLGQASEYNLEDIEEMGAKARPFAQLGIKTTAHYIKQAATEEQRKALSKKVGVTLKDLFAWTQLCDILRVEGVGPEMARLIVAAGAPSIKKLKEQVPADFLVAMGKANEVTHFAGKLPPESLLKQWIDRAKGLESIVKPD